MYMYMSVTVSPLYRGDVMSRSTEKWISGSGRRNRLDVNMTAVCRANLFANRDGRAGVRNEDEKRGRKDLWEGGRWGHRVAEGRTARVERRRTGREHNVSHSARSCIFYDMASNLTSRARHNSRPCGSCVCVYAWILPRLPYARYRGRARVCALNTRAHARMKNRPTHACVHTHSARDRYALRPSTSKPLEVEALRKYNADRRNSPLSVYTDVQTGCIHTHREREEKRERNEK